MIGIRMKETATRLIAKHGQPATLFKPGVPVSDGGGGHTIGMEVPYPVTLVAAAFSEELKLTAGSQVGV